MDISKVIEQEINNVIELVLHFDNYLLHKEENEKKFKLSNNSKEFIKEIIESPKLTNYLCYDENIIKYRNSIGIFKAINVMLNKNKDKDKNSHLKKKVNPYSFNQSTLLSNPFYYGIDAEFYFIKNIIRKRIVDIVKSSFEFKFNENKEKIINKNKNTFVLISNNSLRKVKLRNKYYKSLINNNNNNLSLKDYFIRTDNFKLFDIKNNNSYSYMNIFDNSINRSKLVKNNSCINIMNSVVNKNSSLNNDKYTSIDYNSNSSKNNKNKKSNFYKKRIKNFLNKQNINDMQKSFLPLLYLNNIKYKNDLRFKTTKIPSFSSGMMELIYYNTKYNIKVKEEERFLNECLKETYRSLEKINVLNNSKCFVDYSKSNILKDKNDKQIRKNESNEKKFVYGFEYKNIFRYSVNGQLNKKQKK